MNYYERHLGDYARDTAHLSMLEHGAYGLLLDRYYSTEAGIPADQAHRLARARSKDERAAVDAVLGEFFTLLDGIWINGRAEREVVRAQTKIKAARENGKAGGRPKKNPAIPDQKPTGLSLGSDSETGSKAHQIPDTRYQEEPKTKTARKRSAPAVLVSLPDLVAEGVDQQHATDWLIARKSKGLPLTPTAWADVKAEAIKARVSPAEAIKAAAGNGWAGFKAAWMDEKPRNGHHPSAYELKSADAAKWIKGTSLDRSMIFDPEACDAATPALR